MSNLADKAAGKRLDLSGAALLKQALIPKTTAVKSGPTLSQTAIYEADRKASRNAILSAVDNRDARIAANDKNAWASTAELDTFSGQATNLAAAAVVGTNRLIGDVVGAPSNLNAMDKLARTSQEAIDVWAIPEDQRTPEQNAVLDSIPEMRQQGGGVGMINNDRRTNRDFLTAYEESAGNAREINYAFENSASAKVMNQANRDVLNENLAESYTANEHNFVEAQKAKEEGNTAGYLWGYAKGIAGLAKDGGIDIVKNPAAAFEYMAENAPQIAIGAYSKPLMGLSNSSYAVTTLSTAVDKFEEDNGRLPNRNEQQDILAWGVAIGLAEQVGDSSIVKAVTGSSGSAVSKLITDMTPDAIKAANTTAKNVIKGAGKAVAGKVPDVVAGAAKGAAKVVAPVVNAAGRTAKTGVTEAATEVTQTAIEEELGSLGDFEDIEGLALFQAGVAGAAAGGGIAGVSESTRAVKPILTAAGKVAGVTGDAVSKVKNAAVNKATGGVVAQDKKAQDAIITEGQESGDFSSLLDETNPKTYNPATAVQEYSKREADESLTTEQREEAKANKEAAITGLEEKVAASEIAVQDASAENPAIARIRGEKKDFEELVAHEKAQGRDSSDFQNELDGIVKELAAYEKSPEKKRQDKNVAIEQAKLDANKTRLEQAQNVAASYSPEQAATQAVAQETVDAAVATATAPDATPEAKDKGVDDVLASIRTGGTNITPGQADAIVAANPTMSPEKKKYLEAFSKAHSKINALENTESVGGNITNGRKGFKGLKEYEANVAKAVESNDQEAIDRELSSLEKFTVNHSSKKDALEAAIARSKEINGPVSYYKGPDGNYVTEDGKGPWKDQTERGVMAGWTVSSTPDGLAASTNLLDTVTAELDALSATKDRLESMVEMGKVEPTVTPTVKPTPKAEPKKDKQAKKASYAEKLYTKYRDIINDKDATDFKKINAAFALLKNATTAENVEVQKEAQAVLDTFKDQGYEISNEIQVGQRYTEGSRLGEVDFNETGLLYEDEQIISSVKQPQINKDGVMVQAGKITVDQGTKKREQPKKKPKKRFNEDYNNTAMSIPRDVPGVNPYVVSDNEKKQLNKRSDEKLAENVANWTKIAKTDPNIAKKAKYTAMAYEAQAILDNRSTESKPTTTEPDSVKPKLIPKKDRIKIKVPKGSEVTLVATFTLQGEQLGIVDTGDGYQALHLATGLGLSTNKKTQKESFTEAVKRVNQQKDKGNTLKKIAKDKPVTNPEYSSNVEPTAKAKPEAVNKTETTSDPFADKVVIPVQGGEVTVIENFYADSNAYVDQIEELLKDDVGVSNFNNKKRHVAVVYGPLDYEYSLGGGRKAVHEKNEAIPPFLIQMMREAEVALGKPEGYFNHVLVNRFANNEGIGRHRDAESIYTADDGSTGAVGIYSIGTTSTPHNIGDKDISAFDNSLVEMSTGNLTHSVGKASGTRYSVNFRHIPPNQLPAADSTAKAQPVVGEEAETTPIDFKSLFEAASKIQKETSHSRGAGWEAQELFQKHIEAGRSIKEAMVLVKAQHYYDFTSPDAYEDGYSALAEALIDLGYITEQELYPETDSTPDEQEALKDAEWQKGINDDILRNKEEMAARLEAFMAEDPDSDEQSAVFDQQGTNDQAPGLAEQTPANILEGLGDETLQDSNPIPQYDADGENNAIRRVTQYIQRFFTVSKKQENKSPLALVAVSDFMSQLFTENGINSRLLKDILKVPGKETATIGSAQFESLNTFKMLADKWRDTVTKNFTNAKDQPEYRFEELDKFFVQEDENGNKVVDDNVKTAVMVAAYDYLAENAGGKGYNSDSEINSILNRRSDEDVTVPERNLLADGWDRRSATARKLGAAIVKSLGVQAVKGVSPLEMAKLESALGFQAIALLLQEGAVEQYVMTAPIILGAGNTPMIRIKRDQTPNRVPTYKAAVDVADQNSRSKGFISNLFGSESGVVFPAEFPGEYNQTKLKNSNRQLPETGKKSNQKSSKRPYQVREGIVNLLGQIAPETVARMYGRSDLIPHPELALSIEAQNDAIERDIKETNTFIEERRNTGNAAKPFYLVPKMWGMQRNGLANTIMNPQTNKYARFLMGQLSWNTTLDPSDTADQNLELFFIAVGAGLGIKVDKQNHTKSVDDLHRKMQEPVFAKALEVINGMDGETPLDAEENAILAEAVAAGGEKIHTLDSLMQYNNYLVAKEEGTTFDADIMLEVDGVTNGSALLQTSMGTVGILEAAKFGFFSEESGHTNFPSWKGEAGNLDLYQAVAAAMSRNMKDVTGIAAEFIRGIESITGFITDSDGAATDVGRKLVKTPVTAIGYGAGINSQVAKMGNDFVETFYKKVQKIANNGEDEIDQLVAINELMDQINNMMNLPILDSKGQPLRTPRGNLIHADSLVQALENTRLDPDQVRAIAERYSYTAGLAVSSALDELLGPFLARQKLFNQAAQGLWKRYQAAFNAVHDKMLNDGMEDGSIAYVEKWPAKLDKKGKPVRNKKTGRIEEDKSGKKIRVPRQGLSQTQLDVIYEQLKSVGITIHTAFSKQDDNLEAGFDAEKIMFQAAADAATAEQIVTTDVDNQFPSTRLYQDKSFNVTKTITTNKSGIVNGEVQTSIDPGVRVIALLTQALDSAIMMRTVANNPVLNVHDATGQGVGQTIKAAKDLNKNTLELLAEYSIPGEIAKALANSFANMSALTEQTNEDGSFTYPDLAPTLSELWVGSPFKPIPVNQYFTDFVTGNALVAEVSKLETLLKTAYVNQYGLEGGQYELNADDYANLNAKLANAKQRLADQESQRVKAPKLPQPTGPDIDPNALGETLFTNDADLVQLLSKFTTFEALLQPLKAVLAKNAANESPAKVAFTQKVLDVLADEVPPDTKIIMLNRQLQLPDELNFIETAVGYYVRSENTIYVRGPDFKQSNVTPQLLIHELLHAFSSSAIGKYEHMLKPDAQKLDPKEQDQWQAVQDMKLIIKAAKRSMAYRGLSREEQNSDMFYGLSSLHELMSEGMTNRDFMLFLSKVKVEGTYGSKKKFTSGLTALKNTLAKLFFGRQAKNRDVLNGMDTLMTSFTSLINGSVPGVIPNPETDVLASIGTGKRLPKDYTSEEIFTELGKSGRTPNPVEQKRLQYLLSSVVDTVYQGSSAVRQALLDAAPQDTDDAYINALYTGQRAFVSRIVGPLRLTDQSALVLESIDITMQEALKRSPMLRAEAAKLFLEVKNKIKPEDLPDGVYDLLFNLGNKKDTSNYLSEFMAASLAYEPLNALLRTRTPNTETRTIAQAWADKSFAAAVETLFNRLMDRMGRFIRKTQKGDSYATTFQLMAERLAALEANHQRNLADTTGNSQQSENRFTAKAQAIGEKVRSSVNKAAKATKEYADGDSNLSKGVRIVARPVEWATSKEEIVAPMLRHIRTIRDSKNKQKYGPIMNGITEILGEEDANAAAIEMIIRQNNLEREVRTESQEMSNFIGELFKTPLTEEISESITAALRSDIGSLLNQGFDIDELQQLLKHVGLDNEIDQAFKNVKSHLAIMEADGRITAKEAVEFLAYYDKSAKALGYSLVTSKTKASNVMQNAHNIVQLYASQHASEGTINESDAAALFAQVDKLATLHAIKHMKKQDRLNTAKVMADESNRNDDKPNAMTQVFAIQQGLEADSLDVEFDGRTIHMQKGYTREVFNPNISMQIASKEDGADLELAGYTKEMNGDIGKDVTDPNQGGLSMYSIRNPGISSTVQGFLGLRSAKAKGTVVTDQNPDDPNYSAYGTVAKITKAKRAANESMFVPDPNWNPANVKETFTSPVLNMGGKAAEYRYVASDYTKDNVLERENRVDKVLGGMAGAAIGKTKGRVQNEVGIQLLKDIEQNEYARNPEAFVEISATSDDPHIRERYRLLPQETKRAIQKIWGSEKMVVRKDMLDYAFGYKKVSFYDMFQKNPMDRNLTEKAMVPALELLLGGKKAAHRVLKAQRFWEELVKMVKDARVIKSFVTFLGNETSNMSMMLLHGIGPIAQVKLRTEAWSQTNRFRKDESRRKQLDYQIRYSNLSAKARSDIETEMKVLEEQINNNPILQLMEAGMYQTIVEDIDVEEDAYGWSNSIDEWVTKKTSKVPSSLVKASRFLLMTHDSTSYKVLNRLTVMSDFTARYALTQTLQTRKIDPMSEEMAMRTARGAFVNYDIPTSRELQLLNDLGLIPYTKYYMRIQTALFSAVRNNPAKAFITLLLGDLVSIQDIFGSSILQGIPVNIRPGALDLPEAVSDIASFRLLERMGIL